MIVLRWVHAQSAVVFDRALATGGASGGAAAEKSVIAPQWVPVSQLVLLTMKVSAKSHPPHFVKSSSVQLGVGHGVSPTA